jgi:hypothetical protein
MKRLGYVTMLAGLLIIVFGMLQLANWKPAATSNQRLPMQ